MALSSVLYRGNGGGGCCSRYSACRGDAPPDARSCRDDGAVPLVDAGSSPALHAKHNHCSTGLRWSLGQRYYCWRSVQIVTPVCCEGFLRRRDRKSVV